MTEAKRTRKPSPPRAVPAPVYKKPVVVSDAAKEGLGYYILYAGSRGETAHIFAAMIVLAVVALIAEFLITLLENRLVKWRPAQLADTGF